MRSCCNRTDPDWSALLSQRLQSLESDLEGRLQGFADTIKHGASLSICQRTVVGAECTGDRCEVFVQDRQVAVRPTLYGTLSSDAIKFVQLHTFPITGLDLCPSIVSPCAASYGNFYRCRLMS